MQCPECGAAAKQVIFGPPAEPLTEEQDQLYVFGGCMIDDWAGPVFHCVQCHHQWVVEKRPTPRR